MGTTSSVLKVESTSPSQDAKTICNAFPDIFLPDSFAGAAPDNDPLSSSSVVVLVHAEEKVTIFVVQSPTNSTSLLLVDESYLKSSAIMEQQQQQRLPPHQLSIVVSFYENGKDFSACRLNLPSGSSIVLAGPNLVSSASGRAVLTKLLLPPPSPPSLGQTENNKEEEGEEKCVDVTDDGEMVASSPLETPPPSPLPVFPSLQVRLLQEGGQLSPQLFPLNAQCGVPVKTELFEGHILCLLRPDPPDRDPYWNDRIFSKKKRRVIIQLQGKFRYVPQGIVYAGAEVSQPMKLGLVTRGLSTVLLRLVESFNSNVHYSFGDKKGNEKAHIVVPAYTFFEQIVITSPGETPPPITELFDEPKESRAARKASKGAGHQWNTTDTYSFSFYSMYIDLVHWHIVGIPVSGDISLKTFWGDSLLRIGMYEKGGDQAQHIQEKNTYAFALQVS